MKILIIHDNRDFNEFLQKELRKNGYGVHGLFDGEEGMKHLSLHHSDYSLILTGLRLPGRSGFDICEELRKLEISIPIIVVSRNPNIDDKVKALDKGADDYLERPFPVKELLARIRAVLRRPQSSLPIEFKAKDFVLRPDSLTVKAKETLIPLTLKEFRILEYLIRNSNMIVTRDQILDAMWDFNFNGLSNIVDVHVSHLRKKLKDFGIDIIITVRGVGYMLVA